MARGGDDVVKGRGGADVICGNVGADVLRGGRGDDALFGGWGGLRCFQDFDAIDGDRLVGGRGSDRMNGGRDPRHDKPAPGCTFEVSDRYDVLDFSTARHGVRVELQSGMAEGQGRDTFTHVPWNVVGSPRDDTILGSGQPDGFNLIYHGGPGDDRIEGRMTGDRLTGGAGDDVVLGGAREGVYLYGGGGADDLRGGPMADALRAGPGADHLRGGAGDDFTAGGPGTDRLHGDAGNDRMSGGPDVDVAYGGRGRDGLDWSGLEDTVQGGPDRDVVAAELTGDLGSGEVMGGAAPDLLKFRADRTFASDPFPDIVVDLQLGTTTVSGTAFVTRSFAHLTSDSVGANWHVWGTGADNEVRHSGGVGTLEVRLRDGDDFVEATDGDDLLRGGDGTDTARPGLGVDECVSFEVVVGEC